MTPAPNSYNQETSKQAKLARFDNIHMGTDIKTTAKEIKFTPGPGHYDRIDEQYSRTHHHTTKNGTQPSPNFTAIAMKQAQRSVNKSLDQDELQNAKRSSFLKRQSNTGTHFFGAPTEADKFYETVSNGLGKKL